MYYNTSPINLMPKQGVIQSLFTVTAYTGAWTQVRESLEF